MLFSLKYLTLFPLNVLIDYPWVFIDADYEPFMAFHEIPKCGLQHLLVLHTHSFQHKLVHLPLKMLKKQKPNQKNNPTKGWIHLQCHTLILKMKSKGVGYKRKALVVSSHSPSSSQLAVWVVSENELSHHLFPLFTEIQKYSTWKTGFYSAWKIVWNRPKYQGVYSR